VTSSGKHVRADANCVKHPPRGPIKLFFRICRLGFVSAVARRTCRNFGPHRSRRAADVSWENCASSAETFCPERDGFSARLAPVSTPLPTAAGRSSVARFGIFEADVEIRELRKHGRRIRLQGQPFAVLAALLERPGTVITREELRERLWPADTFVDFDHSLNTAINKIREVLGDSAASPRFIETLARQGYRFLAEVRCEADIPKLGETPSSLKTQTESEVVAYRGLVRVLFILLQIMYLVFYVESLLHWRALDRIEIFNIGAPLLPVLVMVTAGVGIALRFYLISSVAFDHPQLGVKFHRIFLGILSLDLLWAVAPFLMLEKIGFGPAFGATAALLYVPFAERTLVRMAYCHTHTEPSLVN
jgi:cholera toxin transcriptional activator